MAYRTSNSRTTELKHVGEDILFTIVEVDKQQESAVTGIYRVLSSVTRPVAGALKGYGLCKPDQKHSFIHGFDNFIDFLKSMDSDIRNRVGFQVTQELYKGHLLVMWQIQETARNRDLTYSVEKIFQRWMRKIQTVLTQGHQIRRDPNDVGPLHELEYWRSMLIRYISITEFVSSKEFLNHFICLQLSKSKLVKKWNLMDNELTNALCEARDTVRYMSSLEKYWDPLYRCDPPDITKNLPSLIETIRSIYRTSRFYNTSDAVAGFLTKVTSQLTIACQEYLTDRSTVSIWKQSTQVIIDKIIVCKTMLESYQILYFKTVEEMEANPLEIAWDCSTMMLFGHMDTFNVRLDKIDEIMKTERTYSILDRIKISGTEVFANAIKSAFQCISTKGYNPLAHRISTFDHDYDKFMKDVDSTELKLQQFLKMLTSDIPTTHSMLLVLQRFERLNLDCLCIDRRYLDAAVLLEKEIENIKDM